MARYSDLVDDVRSQVPECPERTIEDYIKRAVIDFLRRSRVWRAEITVPLRLDRGEYTVSVDGQGRCDQVRKAMYVTDKSRRALEHEHFSEVAVPNRRLNPGEPTHVGVDASGFVIKVLPVPGGTSFKPADNPRLELSVVAVPGRNSRQFPDFVYEQWYEGLVAGALWMLLGLTSKPWTNSELANEKGRQFFEAVRNAKQAAAAEGWAPMRPRYRRWV